MKLSELNFSYPENLVATEPRNPFRTLLVESDGTSKEVMKEELLRIFKPGDLLVINDTKVSKRRIFTPDNIEMLFINARDEKTWDVLFPARDHKVGDLISLPGELTAKLTHKGLPQTIELSQSIDENYFLEFGEPALPPYIQKARGERRANKLDTLWYQTAWAEKTGSSAAPTASLHFTEQDLQSLSDIGVQIAKLTLHVGLGTFLPIKTDDVEEHVMHKEWVEIPTTTIEKIKQTKLLHGRIIALGTTVTRALEAFALDQFKANANGVQGETALFILPGHNFKVVDVLMTNFHQPGSTLLALVCAFAGQENVLKAYHSAIENKFRLFSYGDLSVWIKPQANLQSKPQ